MFDDSCCAGMALGPPQVSIEGLNELAVVLKLLGTNQASGARSRSSTKREKGRSEKKPISRADATRPGSGSSDSPDPLGTNPKDLIQALADLLLEAAGVETVQMSGGDHERQDHA
ncbi:hypothetical protein ACE103_08295 [Bradyrhizobium sp. ma5]|uniref:hypothetical protein n=1 Tax=Bradyrhizobium sp. ma5 TaxID=3344828 RepID=UPI0035D425FB